MSGQFRNAGRCVVHALQICNIRDIRALKLAAALVLARGTYEPFHVKTDPHSLIDFEAKAKSHVDIVVRQHTYAPFAYTGWHAHPGPVFITVVEGTLTFYEADDPTCSPIYVSAGQGYVDTGRGTSAATRPGCLRRTSR